MKRRDFMTSCAAVSAGGVVSTIRSAGLDWDFYLGPAPLVPFNPKRFIDDAQADRLLTREARKPWNLV